jgi:hypothetical protein
MAFQQPKRSGGDRDAIGLGEKRLERQHLPAERAHADLAPQLGPDGLVVTPGGFRRTREDERADRAGRDRMEMRELARQQHRDRSSGNAGRGLRELRGIVGEVIDHEERRVLRDRASHDTQGPVIAVVPEQ